MKNEEAMILVATRRRYCCGFSPSRGAGNSRVLIYAMWLRQLARGVLFAKQKVILHRLGISSKFLNRSVVENDEAVASKVGSFNRVQATSMILCTFNVRYLIYNLFSIILHKCAMDMDRS